MRFIALAAAALLVTPGLAQDLALEPLSYHESFEGELPEMVMWAKNGDHTINTLEASDEQAFDGEKSLKIDISLEGGSYHYFGSMLKVPAAGTLKLTAQVFVAEGTNTRVGFGTNMIYPPTHHSGCGPTDTFEEVTGEWRRVEIDLAARGASGSDSVMQKHTGTLTGDDVGAYLDRWSLFLYGGEGKRAVVYLDDIRIEGEAPTEADYDAWIDGRWQGAQDRMTEQVAAWREQITRGEAALQAVDAEGAGDRIDAALKHAADARVLIDALEERGYGSASDRAVIDGALFALEHEPKTISAISEARESGAPFLLYTPSAMTNDRLVPGLPLPAPLGEGLSLAACRGEYETVSAAVYAVDDIEDLTLTASDLTGAGTIPSDAIDIRLVKVWYQAGRQIRDLKGRILVPELLLKDDALVRVDTEAQHNYLRSTNEDGTTEYLVCSETDSSNLAGVRPIDADELQPVDVPADGLQQYWITTLVPEDAEAGDYSGTLTFAAGDATREMPLSLTVHDFDLDPSRLIYSVYYRAKLSPDGEPTITSELRSEEQYRAEMEDMLAHGCLYPSNYQGWTEPLLERTLEIRRAVGMPGGPFYNLGRHTGNTSDPEELARLQESVREWIELCEGFGYDEVYFYGIDEATGERLVSQRNTWEAVRDAGGKTFVACYLKTYEAIGDLLDLAVLAGAPNPDEGAKYHATDSQVFCYANPQVGPEEPETFRRNYGLVLWKAGFDGAMDYAYQHGFTHVWNDFDSEAYRDHNFTYPTVNGVIPTVQWAGFREATDDIRYITTLENLIADSEDAATANEAQAWLDGIDPKTVDLDEMRKEAVRWIGRLR